LVIRKTSDTLRPVPKFAFWNLNQRDLPQLVSALARRERVDVLILAECGTDTWRMLEALNAESSDYQLGYSNCDRLRVFTRFDARLMPPLVETERVSIRRLELPARKSLLVVGAHLPSKVNYSDDSQVFESVCLARLIEDAENSEGHRRTLLLGDLNMNPFEPGVVGARGGLHAVMSRKVVNRMWRTVQQENYRFFYNPMWSHMGDRTDAGGTYYYDGAEAVCYFWNMYDQVLLRPELLGDFAPEHVRIVTEVDGTPLMSNGRPDESVASDDLPVMVKLEF
jgi:hypothetical protein